MPENQKGRSSAGRVRSLLAGLIALGVSTLGAGLIIWSLAPMSSAIGAPVLEQGLASWQTGLGSLSGSLGALLGQPAAAAAPGGATSSPEFVRERPGSVSINPWRGYSREGDAGAPLAEEAPSPLSPASLVDIGAAAAPEPVLVLEPANRLRIASIGLDAKVSAAPLVEVKGQKTWQIPWWDVGQAQGTAYPGQRGNMVFLGHVSTINAGKVFKDLNKVKPGDQVVVETADREFVYVVEEVSKVDRTDVSVLRRTPEPMATLITCIGQWLPSINDFSHRLIVRARLQA